MGKQRLASMKRVNIKKKSVKAKADPTRSGIDEDDYTMASDEDGGDDENDYTMGSGLDGVGISYDEAEVDGNLYTDAAADFDDDDDGENDYALAVDDKGGSNFFTQSI